MVPGFVLIFLVLVNEKLQTAQKPPKLGEKINTHLEFLEFYKFLMYLSVNLSNQIELFKISHQIRKTSCDRRTIDHF
jgi:hypothetical protein